MDQKVIDLEQRLCRLERIVIKLEALVKNIFSVELLQQTTPEEDADGGNNSNVCSQQSMQLPQPSTVTLDSVPRLEQKGRENIHVPVAKADITIMTNNIQKPWFTSNSDFFTTAEFLERFEKYSHVQNAGATDSWMISMVYDCLSGSPKIWYRMYSYKFVSWDLFKMLFLKQFWGNRRQREFKNLLHSGTYEQKGKTSKMSTYFARMLSKARYMTLPPTECEILSLLTEHFPKPIREDLRHANSIETFYDFLIEEDLARNNKTSTKPSFGELRIT